MAGSPSAQMASGPATPAGPAPLGILSAAEAGRLMPATVFFEGKTAAVQARNAAGVRLRPDSVVLAALVDASGYSSAVQEKYQAYLIAETPVTIGGHPLPAGAYGVGFLPDSTFLVMDIGGHTLFTVPSARDASLRRPMPMQILVGSAADQYRLYEGRAFVVLRDAQP
jgi:hypothetical protein